MKYKIATLCFILSGLSFPPVNADLLLREDVTRFIQNMVAKHDYDADELGEIFSQARLSKNIISTISRPAEALPWYKYKSIFIRPDRIREGVEFWRQNKEQLERAEKQYGVPVEIMVAIIGVETKYGRNTGSYKVIDSLSTLAFDYPKRSKFFTSELEHYLLLAREQSLDPHSLKGSYAGAMGIPQFISSSYRAYAVDFDEDGLVDIWQNPTDAIGSVGNYFKQHGWREGDETAFPAIVANQDLSAFLTDGLKPVLTISDLSENGITSQKTLDGSEKVKILQLENKDGHEYWLALHNFYVITRYNHSALYAMAVYQLADKIKKSLK